MIPVNSVLSCIKAFATLQEKILLVFKILCCVTKLFMWRNKQVLPTAWRNANEYMQGLLVHDKWHGSQGDFYNFRGGTYCTWFGRLTDPTLFWMEQQNFFQWTWNFSMLRCKELFCLCFSRSKKGYLFCLSGKSQFSSRATFTMWCHRIYTLDICICYVLDAGERANQRLHFLFEGMR